MDTGVKVSGAAHLGLILWAMLGGLFSFETDDAMTVSDVTVISSAEFAAMMAAQSRAPEVAPQSTPRPRPAPVETPTPEVTEAPEPAPQVEEAPEVPPAELPVETPPAPVQPDVPEGQSSVVAPENPPAPDAAPRVAPTPVERPEPDANLAEEVQQAAREEAIPEAQPVPDVPKETTAPQEAGTVIETEASQEAGGAVAPSLAPEGAPRPPSRPNRPAPVEQPRPVQQAAAPSTPPEPAPAEEPATEATTDDFMADAIASAVAEAAAPEPQAGQGSAPSGPPLTAGEKDGLRIAVQQCWNVGALSSDALNTTVTVYVAMQENGQPESGSIRMLGYEGGTEAAAQQAFETARRAIIRCGSRGYDLPPEKYSQWREIEMIFNPDNMRIR